ncbi:MAG: TerB family tellurite resistance protein [Rhodospirillales bacterium]|jgi:tellurite resistance protein|nr:TerB family tellurite resistance protein [Rhodospirillales bacterium]MDP7215734.1 TerB family tellurite resistance protein [Rhodospirillales bacterium]HIJ44113.1 tellurite resistance TerB family protein [Rhodospirillaceae bacterium]
MTSFLHNLTHRYQEQMERHKNRPFLKGSMAACALVATADGNITFSQRVRVDQLLQTLEALKFFDPHEGIDLFNEFTDTILSAPEAGHGKALQAVFETVKDKQATAELLIRLCLAVSEANGEISLNDQIEIVSLCSLLGVKPKKCGLYTDRSPEELITDSRWYKQARRREASD